MVTMAQRIEQLRTERSLSQPALSAALGFPKMTIEKFEAGRQTPSQEQQEKMAAYFAVSVFYLRGENNDRTRMDDWMDGAFSEPEQKQTEAPVKQTSGPAASPPGEGSSLIFNAFLRDKKFQGALRAAALDVLQSPEGQEILAKAIRRELARK